MDTIRDHLDAFLSEMVQRRKLRPNTIRAYRFDLQLAAAALPGPLETITLEAVESWLYAPPVATSTSNRRAASLGRFFTWAQRHGVCTTNPLLLHEPTPAPRRLPNPIRHAQHRTQLDAAIKAAPQPYRLVFTILRETGMRAGEVLGLTYDDVCLDPGRAGLRLRETKNGHPRTVILEPAATPQTIRGLRAWLRKQGDLPHHVPLFRSNRDTSVSYRVLYYQWRQLSVAAGLVDADGDPLYTIHQLRHTRGTELIEQGYRMEIVQRLLGHRDPRSTQGYAEVSDLLVRQALAEQRSR